MAGPFRRRARRWLAKKRRQRTGFKGSKRSERRLKEHEFEKSLMKPTSVTRSVRRRRVPCGSTKTRRLAKSVGPDRDKSTEINVTRIRSPVFTDLHQLGRTMMAASNGNEGRGWCKDEVKETQEEEAAESSYGGPSRFRRLQPR